jgi:hypothetical protein
MTDPAGEAARSAAMILAPGVGPNLPAEVEAALAARGTQQRPDRYLDPVSLSSLIVSSPPSPGPSTTTSASTLPNHHPA